MDCGPKRADEGIPGGQYLVRSLRDQVPEGGDLPEPSTRLGRTGLGEITGGTAR